MSDRGAIFSECGRWRYRLWRHWMVGHPPLTFLMLNPSTADAEKNDPTIERCERRARRGGFGGVQIVNLFAYRSTDPRALLRLSQDEAIGPENDEAILFACGRSHAVVAAWGAWGSLHGRAQIVAAKIRSEGIGLWALGVTKHGEPRHPLYISNDTPIRPWTEQDARLEGCAPGLTPIVP